MADLFADPQATSRRPKPPGDIATDPNSPPTAPPTQPPAAAPTSVGDSFQQALVNKLNPAGVDQSNSAIQPAIAANRLAEQRGVEQQQNTLAEQAARNGTSMSGGNDALSRGILADSATRQGQFAGQAVQHLQDQQDADQMAALGLGNSVMGREQQGQQFGQTLAEQQAAREQQGSQFNQNLYQQGSQFDRQLAEKQWLDQLDADIRKQGVTSQTDLGNRDIDLRGRLGNQQGNLSLLSLLMNNDQFGRSQAQQAAQYGSSLDQSGLLGLLGLLG